MTVGFVGVGAMGLPMARKVLAQASVVVYDPSAERVAVLASEGAAVAGSPREVAESAEIVVLMVATPDQLESALFGEQGVSSGLHEGSAVVIMSSVGVDAVRGIEERLTGRRVTLVDAPVTGGVARAVTGELTILAGGSAEALAAVQPVLELMSRKVAHCGPRVGDGQAVKLVNQLLCSVHLAAAAEALSFAEAIGLDPEVVLHTIEGGGAASFMLSDRGPRMLSAHEPPVLSAIDIFVKDSSLVVEAARAASTTVPLVECAGRQFAAARERGWGRRDDSKVIDVYGVRTDFRPNQHTAEK